MRIPLFFLALVAAGSVSAQIEPPDFLCTRSESGEEVLRWDNTSTACGAYEATEIFTAPTPTGPFTQLAELTNASATEYRDPNPTGELRYYFVRYRYDCPGQTVLNSDTLDNRIPATPVVQYAGVEDGEIVLDWLPSTSPEVTRYNVFEVTLTATTLVGQVMAPTTEFRLPVAGVTITPDLRSFRLVALDGCDNDSPLGTIVSPMSLAVSGGTGCEADIVLTTDPTSLAAYLPATLLELFVSVDDGPYVSAGTAPPNASELVYREANDGETLCFYVEAVLVNDFGRARSVEVCQTVSLSQPVREFTLFGVGHEDDDQLLLTYEEPTIIPEIDAVELRFNRSNELFSEPLATPFFTGTGTFAFPATEEPGTAISVRVTDACGREVTTNEVVPVTLSGRPLVAGQNLLGWTAFTNNLAGTVTYELFRAEVPFGGAVAGASFVSIASGLTDLNYSDGDMPAFSEQVCYRVVARYQEPGEGPRQAYTFASNTICISPPTEVYLPNAFSPSSLEATNQEFRPYFSTPPPAAGYELLIFDRWGGLRFRSVDPNAGWPGTSDGQLLSSGTYLYQLRYVDNAGRPREVAGTVNLIR